MLRWKLTGKTAALDELADNIAKNIDNPINELMWAAPGTMLCAWFLYQATEERRWRDLFQRSADYLFATWKLDESSQYYAWTQHMYGIDAIHLGAVHGFAGNILPMLKGIELLSNEQQQLLLTRTEQTLMKTAQVEVDYANWLPCLGKARPGRETPVLHICHGAPGTVIATADMWPLASPAYQKLMLQAANLIWQAGPLKKPWGLCHGTAGNGYALLKLPGYAVD
ncbi:MAG: hypothetical protein GY821_17815 [Gammaproteobacteria bacterium]|nr:hypothetical protein [Gammaproteobacteria bacterium]